MSQSSQDSDYSRRRPLRLDWPESKRPRRVTMDSNKCSQLWTELYAPKTSDQLAVAPKKVKQVREWLTTPVNDRKLLLLVGSPGIGKSTMVHILAKEVGLSVLEWSESYYGDYDRRNRIENQSPMTSFQEFLSRNGTGFGSLTNGHNKPSLIVIDELPNLHTPEMMTIFRETMIQHVQTSTTKTLWIFSDTVEGKVDQQKLNALIDPCLCCIIQMSPPTKPKFAKVIKAIRRSVDAESLYEASRGDLRFAISNLQFQLTGKSRTMATERDTRLSSFHALGKLLYAKRDKDGELTFDPEAVMQNSDMETSAVMHFVACHCPEFFTEVEELAAALADFSDAAIMGEPAASSIVARAVATANHHKSAHKFRHFGAPGIFEVYRKRRETQQAMLSYSSRCSPVTVATDLWPFVRAIAPETLDQIDSKVFNLDDQEEFLNNQNEVLMHDDIIEDSDDDF